MITNPPPPNCLTQSAEKRSLDRLASSGSRFADFLIEKIITQIYYAFSKHPNKPTVHFVYIIVSVPRPDRYYVGLTESVRRRLGQHNQGIVHSTAHFRPWRLRTAVCFSSRTRAAEFERYLKTGSGIAFQRKRLL
jgi:putative endonuclease